MAGLNVHQKRRLRRLCNASAQLGELVRANYEEWKRLGQRVVAARGDVANAASQLTQQRLYGSDPRVLGALEARHQELAEELAELTASAARLEAERAAMEREVNPLRSLCDRLLVHCGLDEDLRPVTRAFGGFTGLSAGGPR